MPLISVNMPVYNGERFLAAALESVLAQTFSDFEFIIVDDGSRDRSVEIIRAYEARDSRILLAQSQRNLGGAAARNLALALSSGEFIALMDCDDVCRPERLERQLDFLRARPDIGVLGAGARAVDQQLKPLYDFDLPQRHALIVFNLFLGSFLIHPTVMIRRELLEAVGGYEPGRRTAIDTELWSRLIWRTRFANLPETLLLYRRHEAQNSTTRDAELTAEAWQPRERLLKRLWGEAPRQSLWRFQRMREDEKLSWLQRRRARDDLGRLLEALIEQGAIDEDDRADLAAHAKARLEATMPRRWQRLLHWRRRHFGR